MRHLIASFLLLTASSLCATTPIYKDASAPIETRVADLLSRMTTEEKAGALPTAWYPGAEGGTAVAKAIFGEVNVVL